MIESLLVTREQRIIGDICHFIVCIGFDWIFLFKYKSNKLKYEISKKKFLEFVAVTPELASEVALKERDVSFSISPHSILTGPWGKLMNCWRNLLGSSWRSGANEHRTPAYSGLKHFPQKLYTKTGNFRMMIFLPVQLLTVEERVKQKRLLYGTDLCLESRWFLQRADDGFLNQFGNIKT